MTQVEVTHWTWGRRKASYRNELSSSNDLALFKISYIHTKQIETTYEVASVTELASPFGQIRGLIVLMFVLVQEA